jgi:hypothetical protein
MSTATLHAPPPLNSTTPAGPMTDIASLRLMPIVGPLWFRGLVRPEFAHLLETEDGQARHVNVDGRTFLVAPAPCRAFLTDRALHLPIAADVSICPECQGIAELVHGLAWDQERQVSLGKSS